MITLRRFTPFGQPSQGFLLEQIRTGSRSVWHHPTESDFAMRTHFRVLSLFLLISVTACTASAGAQPTSEQVVTAVVPTVEANTPEISTATIQVSTPQVSSNILPRSLHFLGRDSQSLMQVFRMDRDGKTITQLTSEPGNVLDYDVSRADGSLVYEVDNRLNLVDADGSNRRVLVEGATHGIIYGIYHPVFSPDGGTIAYALNGLNTYSVAASTSTLVAGDHPLGSSTSPEHYQPDVFSPDGTKLLVTVLNPPDSPYTTAIYSFTDNAFVKFIERDESPTCCTYYGSPAWSPDSASFYGIATVPDSDYKTGELWKVNASDGVVTKLVTSTESGVNLMKAPFMAPDGQLYFFLGTYDMDSAVSPATLELVRSAADGVTGRTILKGDNFLSMNEALWAPDASLVVIAFAPSADVQRGGRAEVVFLDERPNVALTEFAEKMKWGP
jgi:hypothetical protein